MCSYSYLFLYDTHTYGAITFFFIYFEFTSYISRCFSVTKVNSICYLHGAPSAHRYHAKSFFFNKNEPKKTTKYEIMRHNKTSRMETARLNILGHLHTCVVANKKKRVYILFARLACVYVCWCHRRI